MATTTTLSSKGQLVLPKEVRDRHQFHPGQEFEVMESEDGIVLKPRDPFPETTFEKVRGCLQSAYDGPPVPVEEMTGARYVEQHAEKYRPDQHAEEE